MLEDGLYPVLEAKGTAGLMEALKEVGEVKDEEVSAAMMDFERLWKKYRTERHNDTTQYGGGSESSAQVNSFAD